MNNNLPSSDLLIRPASFNDIQTIRELAIETWSVAYKSILDDGQMSYMLELFYSSESLKEQIENKHYFFIAFKDYAPVGFTSFSCVEKTTYKLQKLYVTPLIQKTGAGKALLDTVESVAKSMGALTLLLNVNRNNAAQHFYERNGFAVLRQEDIDIGRGYFMNDFIMEKKL